MSLIIYYLSIQYFWLVPIPTNGIFSGENAATLARANQHTLMQSMPSTKDVARCACGQTWAYHKTHGVEGVGEQGEVWSPTHHTISLPTDAFGTIDFLGGPRSNLKY